MQAVDQIDLKPDSPAMTTTRPHRGIRICDHIEPPRRQRLGLLRGPDILIRSETEQQTGYQQA